MVLSWPCTIRNVASLGDGDNDECSDCSGVHYIKPLESSPQGGSLEDKIKEMSSTRKHL